MSAILECINLNKNYGRTEAVRNLDLKLDEHVIYGLLGRNGAGKTTLLNMITGGISPSYGEIMIDGKRLKFGDSPTNTCYVREKNYFFGGAKIMEILTFASTYHPNWDWTLAHELLRTFKLAPNKKIRQLSRGMESLVGNVIGLASRAPLTILDEPVLGLDVLMRERFYSALMEDYADHPRTFLISTHLIDEIAKVVERVCIIEKGGIMLDEDVDGIRAKSYLLRGASDALAGISSGKRIIFQENYGNGALLALYDTLDEGEKIEASRAGIAVEALPLQKFFAYMIEGGEDRE